MFLGILIFAAAAALSSTQAAPVDVAGSWQVAWQGRLGTQECLLNLQSQAGKITGTFQNRQGVSPVTGTLDGNKVLLDVHFQGSRPYTVRFTGTAGATGQLSGDSQAIGLGASGGYLGHGGEIVQPDHPWTAKRVVNQTGTQN